MDSTLIDAEMLEVMAQEYGCLEAITEITQSAMHGDIPFDEAVRLRLALLKGFPEQRIYEIAHQIPLMPGAKRTIAQLQQMGFHVVMITGGFTHVAHIVAQRLGITEVFANEFVVEDEKLTGGFNLTVNKREILKELTQKYSAEVVVAVGDGANDLPMLEAADIGIGFCPHKIIQERIPLQIHEKNLARMLDFFTPRELTLAVDASIHPACEKMLSFLGTVVSTDLSNVKNPVLKDADALVVRTNCTVNQEYIDACEKLKMIASATTGLNHIDTEYVEQKGIVLSHAKGENACAVADYVMRMLLHATDDVFYTNHLLKKTGAFKEIKRRNHRTEMRYKTMGIVGLGHVGRMVANRARSFGMHVKAYDPYVEDATHTLDEVLACDVVTLHPELTTQTHHMIGTVQLEKMKQHAILINASRGEIVNEEELITHLRAGKIRMAILDVFENEPAHSVLYELENTLCTPHIAGNTVEARINAAKCVAAQLFTHFVQYQTCVMHNE